MNVCVRRWRPGQRAIMCLLTLVVAFVAFPFASATAHARPRIAVVLGGGSAQGYNHVGVLKALEEEGIPIDLLVGSSMGSVIGGLYSAGLSSDNLFEVADRVDLTEYFSPIIPPRGGLLDARRLEILLDRLTDGATFENLKVPFYSVTTELTTGEEVALHQGSLARAMIASMSIPGLFPPIAIDGRHFVDGGLKNAVPVNVARAADADIVIAVDVRNNDEQIDPDNILSNMQQTLRYMIQGYAAQHLSSADIVIEATLEHASPMDFNRMPHFVAQGYAAAKGSMTEIRRVILEHDPAFSFHEDPSVPGLSNAELESRIRAAQEAARLRRSRYAFSLHPSFHPDFRYSGGLTYRVGDASRPRFAEWEFARGAEDESTYHGIRWYHGDCRIQLCASVGGRVYRGESSVSPGISTQWPIGAVLSAGFDWESGAPGASWQARIEARPKPGERITEHTYGLEAGRDPRGLSGQARPDPYIQVDSTWRIALTRYGVGVGDVLQLHPSLVLGAGTSAYFDGGSVEWERVFRAGIGLETRLYGLYGNRFRVETTYQPRDGNWSVGLRFGE